MTFTASLTTMIMALLATTLLMLLVGGLIDLMRRPPGRGAGRDRGDRLGIEDRPVAGGRSRRSVMMGTRAKAVPW